jgi:hypothetical protein
MHEYDLASLLLSSKLHAKDGVSNNINVNSFQHLFLSL